MAAALSDGTEVVCECCLLGTALLVMVLVGVCMLGGAGPCIRQLCVALQNGIWHFQMDLSIRLEMYSSSTLGCPPVVKAALADRASVSAHVRGGMHLLVVNLAWPGKGTHQAHTLQDTSPAEAFPTMGRFEY